MSGSQRRRDLVKEGLWRERVREQLASGLTVRAYCLREQISEPSFYAWRKALAKRDLAPSGEPVADAKATMPKPTALPAFAEIVVSSPVTSSAIEIILNSSRRVLVSPGFDAATLQAVVELLERPRC